MSKTQNKSTKESLRKFFLSLLKNNQLVEIKANSRIYCGGASIGNFGEAFAELDLIGYNHFVLSISIKNATFSKVAIGHELA